MLSNRFNVCKMFSNKFASRVVKRISKERFSTNAVEATEEIQYGIKALHEETICQREK